jgi:hypothetical protein
MHLIVRRRNLTAWLHGVQKLRPALGYALSKNLSWKCFPHRTYSKTGNGLITVAGGRDVQTGMAKSGMGSEVKNFRVYRDSQRAPEFAFFRRALSVLIPVPAYILR